MGKVCRPVVSIPVELWLADHGQRLGTYHSVPLSDICSFYSLWVEAREFEFLGISFTFLVTTCSCDLGTLCLNDFAWDWAIS